MSAHERCPLPETDAPADGESSASKSSRGATALVGSHGWKIDGLTLPRRPRRIGRMAYSSAGPIAPILGFVVSIPTPTVGAARGRGVMASRPASRQAAQGHSIVEFALLLPLISFMLLAAVDFARVSSIQQ